MLLIPIVTSCSQFHKYVQNSLREPENTRKKAYQTVFWPEDDPHFTIAVAVLNALDGNNRW